MDEMFNYIFGSLKRTEEAAKHSRRMLRNQTKFNRTVTAVAFAVFVRTILIERNIQKQNEKIEKLSRELEELKHKEGE